MLVQNTGDFIRHIGTRLIPGANELNEEESVKFNEALKNPLNDALKKSGEIVVKTEGAKGIEGLNAKDAIEMISDTFDLNLLDKMLEEETEAKQPRKTVIDAIEKQADSILNPDEDTIVDQND